MEHSRTRIFEGDTEDAEFKNEMGIASLHPSYDLLAIGWFLEALE